MSEDNNSNQLTLFAEGGLASHSVSPGSDEARQMTAISGRRCTALLRNSDPVGSLVRMSLVSSRWNSTKSFLTWKIRGTPHGRLLFQLVPWTRLTDDPESGLLPTPTADDANNATRASGTFKSLTREALLPTPTARDWRSPNNDERFPDQLPNFVGGKLNPEWVEWLMGYPVGWTDLKPSATQRSRKSSRKSGA